MTDTSGINTDAYQAELQAAEDDLVAAFPKKFQSKFKVYDFGFYLHNESYSGGYPEAFAQAIADVSAKSTYYLLFGKQTDHSGGYTKFWVDLKLPTTGKLSCLPEELMGFLSDQVEENTMVHYPSKLLKEMYSLQKWITTLCYSTLTRYMNFRIMILIFTPSP